jgi:hypothetical protein
MQTTISVSRERGRLHASTIVGADRASCEYRERRLSRRAGKYVAQI